DRRGPRRERAAGRDFPRRQGGCARLPRRPGDEGDERQGRPEGGQPPAAGEAEGVVRSSSRGAARIDELNVPTTAAASVQPVKRAMVARGDAELSSSPATSGPSGTASTRSVLETDSTRPTRRSGVSAYQYAAIAESVFGKQKACTANATPST